MEVGSPIPDDQNIDTDFYGGANIEKTLPDESALFDHMQEEKLYRVLLLRCTRTQYPCTVYS